MKDKAPLKKTTARKASATQPIKAKKVLAELMDDHEDSSLAPVESSADRALPDHIDPVEIDTITTKVTREISSSDPVALYLAESRKYPLLSREQEQVLAKKYYDTKDPSAAQALVTSNLRFVVKVAAEYSRFGAKLIDLVQEGNMGLMHAVRDFNPYKGNRLITYAVWWIRGYIQEYLMKQYSMVKIGTTQNQKKLFYQLQKEREALDALGERPDIKLISARLGIPEDEVEIMAQRMSGRDISLDRPLDDESPNTLMDLQKSNSEDIVEKIGREEELSQLQHILEDLRPELNSRELLLLEERLLNDEPLTLEEIGDKYGITREAVRQAEVRLMKKIKDRLQK